MCVTEGDSSFITSDKATVVKLLEWESIEGGSSDSSSILGHTVTLTFVTGGSTSRGTRGEL